jgi:hypothetical protein
MFMGTAPDSTPRKGKCADGRHVQYVWWRSEPNTGVRVLLTEDQCAYQDAPADGDMPGLAAPQKQLKRRQRRGSAVLLAVVWREARKQ